jgi:hypothetical protein
MFIYCEKHHIFLIFRCRRVAAAGGVHTVVASGFDVTNIRRYAHGLGSYPWHAFVRCIKNASILRFCMLTLHKNDHM